MQGLKSSQPHMRPIDGMVFQEPPAPMRLRRTARVHDCPSGNGRGQEFRWDVKGADPHASGGMASRLTTQQGRCVTYGRDPLRLLDVATHGQVLCTMPLMLESCSPETPCCWPDLSPPAGQTRLAHILGLEPADLGEAVMSKRFNPLRTGGASTKRQEEQALDLDAAPG